MKTVKERIIYAHGLKDGRDNERYALAERTSVLMNGPVSTCFCSVVQLEQKGLLKFFEEMLRNWEAEELVEKVVE